MPSNATRQLLDRSVYERAVVLGRSAAGVSGPNPPVGCVIVRDGVVVGEGSTSAIGGPHAEVVALGAAGPAAHGAVAVVTLEPCAHHGRTGPCTEALVAAGVAEVHVVLRDPDRSAAGGMERLRAAGITVVEVAVPLPDVAASVSHDLRGFFSRVAEGRPHVTLKLAQTVDGRTAPGPEGYLTGIAARTHVHRLRADVDAVLVGSGTVRADDPRLDARHVPVALPPRPVVLATTADVDPRARVIARGAVVIVGEGAPAGACRELAAAGATVVRVPTVEQGDGSRPRTVLDLRAALAALLDHRILTVLAEPGPRLADALLAAGLVDEVELHIAAAAAGATGPGAVPTSEVVPALPRLATMLVGWHDRTAAIAAAGSDSDVPAVEVHELEGDVILRATPARLGSRPSRPSRPSLPATEDARLGSGEAA